MSSLEEKKKKLIEKGYQIKVASTKLDLFTNEEFFDVISPKGRHILNGITVDELTKWLERVNIVG